MEAVRESRRPRGVGAEQNGQLRQTGGGSFLEAIFKRGLKDIKKWNKMRIEKYILIFTSKRLLMTRGE